jgi:superoxide reductase
MENSNFYRCEECGKIVTIVVDGGGELVCCGQPMKKLIANSVDASVEKHVPIAIRYDGKLDVSIGAVLHPMTSEHYIQWVALVTERKVEITYLMPNDQPSVQFLYHVHSTKVEVVHSSADEDVVPNCEGNPCNFSYNELADESVAIYAYCNLHGLWKAII